MANGNQPNFKFETFEGQVVTPAMQKAIDEGNALVAEHSALRKQTKKLMSKDKIAERKDEFASLEKEINKRRSFLEEATGLASALTSGAPGVTAQTTASALVPSGMRERSVFSALV